MDCLKQIIGGYGTPPNFVEKTFADGSQTSKSAKVFSLESFLLYGTLYMYVHITLTLQCICNSECCEFLFHSTHLNVASSYTLS